MERLFLTAASRLTRAWPACFPKVLSLDNLTH
jgi:hypothetical protein